MVQTFAKPQPARQLEARNRARQRGVRVAVVSHARSYITASQSEPGIVYRIEREGWPFGQVAPLRLVPGTAAYDDCQARAAQARAELYG